jgi:proline racemase
MKRMPSTPEVHPLESWSPRGRIIRTVDAHTGGEPLRVIVDGFPELEGDTILARRRDARARFDALRTALMWEPRGHADMYGCILTPPVSAGADFGVLFLHNEGYSTMCGHGIIGVVTVVLETGWLKATEPITRVSIDTPAGLVVAKAHVDGGRVHDVEFRNVPSFVTELDGVVAVPSLGQVRFDLAFGGAFYAFVDADRLGIECTPENYRRIIEAGIAIKNAVSTSRTIVHPGDADLGFLYGTIFIAATQSAGVHSRNVCVFADGEVDRSPTGTGVSARVAIHHARGELEPGTAITIESIIGSRFTACIAELASVGSSTAVIPEVGGQAFITGRNEFILDPDDPLRDGFFLR